MIRREEIIKKIKLLPEDTLKEVADFIEFLEERQRKISKKEDALAKVIGICEGPPDLAERHNRYVYE
jgi:hypothetical protein